MLFIEKIQRVSRVLVSLVIYLLSHHIFGVQGFRGGAFNG